MENLRKKKEEAARASRYASMKSMTCVTILAFIASIKMHQVCGFIKLPLPRYVTYCCNHFPHPSHTKYLVRDVRAEVSAHDAVPSGIVLFVELLLDVAGDVFLDVVLLQRLSRAVHGILAGRKNERGRDKKCT